MSDIDLTQRVLEELRRLDVKVSIDDFGTGYSSLSYLKGFPINELKIDKAFVDGLPENKGDRAITLAIVSMAKALGLKLVAEGVESESQVEYLKGIGCDLIQGYFYSKPLISSDFMEFVRDRNSNEDLLYGSAP